MRDKYDLAVFIARTQPLHLGHCAVIDAALQNADHVCILVGSSFQPRNYRNPFLFQERYEMIRGTYAAYQDRITVMPLEDCIYNDGTWVQNVQACVADCIEPVFGPDADIRITLIGHSKDHSSFYLKMFPQWDSINVSGYESEEFVLAATDIRNSYFLPDPDSVRAQIRSGALDRVVPLYVRGFLEGFMRTPDYRDIREEYEFVQKYKSAWAAAPYAPTFVTVDAVVVQSGHILLVQRKSRPGRGLWALPGGFLEQGERIQDGVLRELREETRIKVPAPVLRGSIRAEKVFDDPHRSARGRTITHGFLIHLQPDVKLPQVKGSDDAAYAKWWPLAEVHREMMFEDHFDLVQHFTAMI
jgi:bifunctional NMN adenylyltransferase/nudix hydrolase